MYFSIHEKCNFRNYDLDGNRSIVRDMEEVLSIPKTMASDWKKYRSVADNRHALRSAVFFSFFYTTHSLCNARDYSKLFLRVIRFTMCVDSFFLSFFPFFPPEIISIRERNSRNIFRGRREIERCAVYRDQKMFTYESRHLFKPLQLTHTSASVCVSLRTTSCA